MYGNTHHVASAVASGLASKFEAIVVPVNQMDTDLLESADLLVVGGPTHIHGMTRPMSRAAAVEAAAKPDSGLDLEPDPEGAGLREWFDRVSRIETAAAAFDTRMEGPAALTGRASKGIARRLRHHGASLIAEPKSFSVTKDNQLVTDEEARAIAWGTALVEQFAGADRPSRP
jgi:hypothetical protein